MERNGDLSLYIASEIWHAPGRVTELPIEERQIEFEAGELGLLAAACKLYADNTKESVAAAAVSQSPMDAHQRSILGGLAYGIDKSIHTFLETPS